MTVLRTFRYLRDVVGVTFLSQSFITPRYTTSSYKNYRRGRSLFARAGDRIFLRSENSSTIHPVLRPSSWMLQPRCYRRADRRVAVASWSRRISSAERAVRDRSVRFLSTEREMYLSVFSRKTSRDFVPVFRAMNVCPEGRNSDVTLLPLPERRIFLLLSKSADDRR